MAFHDGDIAARLAAFPTHQLRTAAGTLAYRTAGGGRPAVLLHGIGSSSASWLTILEQPPKTMRLLAWDAPGYGASTRLTARRPKAADYAEVLRQWLTALDVKHPVLIGHSLGAIIAAAYAAAHPSDVARLFLLNPARGYGGEAEKTRAEKLNARLAALDAHGPEGLAQRRADRLVSAAASPAARRLVRWSMSRINPAGYRQAAHMLASADILNDVRDYDGPALVACGAEDVVTPPAIAQAVAAALPHGAYRETPAVGHASYVENPAAFLALLQSFTAEAAWT